MESSERIALAIEYSGTGFVGSQRQTRGRTVQQELEEALARIADHSVRVTFAGRTDSGVHATHQVVDFATDATRPLDAWVRGANTYLPEDITIRSACAVDEKFNARFSARWRRYMYIFGEAVPEPAIGRDLVEWVPRKLDHKTLHDASHALLGECDFSSFRAAGCQSRTPMRRIHSIEVVRIGRFVVLDVVANAFLMRMVRNIAGALLELSNKRLGVNYVADLLALRDRERVPSTAAARGLYLVQIWYDGQPSLSKLSVPMVLGENSPFSECPNIVCSTFSRTTTIA